MTDLVASGYVSNASRTVQEVKDALEQLRDFMSEGLGGGAAESATIASGTITPSASVVVVDTQSAAATDDLTNIVTTNTPDGRILILRSADDGRNVVVKNAAGGAGQITLADSTDLTLDVTTQALILRRSGTDWVEIGRFYGNNKTAFRTFLGFGTAAQKNTGTSGDAVPLLNAANTWSAAQSFASATGETFSRDGGAKAIYHDRLDSPGTAATAVQQVFRSRDSASALQSMVRADVVVSSASSGAHAAYRTWYTASAGSLTERARLGTGLRVGNFSITDGAGYIGADRFVFGDNAFNARMISSEPSITFDTNQLLALNRTSNVLSYRDATGAIPWFATRRLDGAQASAVWAAQWSAYAQNSAGTEKEVSRIGTYFTDPTNTSESSRLSFYTMDGAGTLGAAFHMSSEDGMYASGLSAPGTPGAGNFTALYVNGVAVAGGIKSIQEFTASGTWNRPAGVTKVLVVVTGGGGGSGSSHSVGGGGGGTAVRVLDVSAIASAAVTVGAGGGTGTGGGDGGASSFGSYAVGDGGTGSNAGGHGGGASGTGALIFAGQDAPRQDAESSTGTGFGGGSYWGMAPRSANYTLTSTDSTFIPGLGAWARTSTGVTRAGCQGKVVVYEF